jgi:hypothetical protein
MLTKLFIDQDYCPIETFLSLMDAYYIYTDYTQLDAIPVHVALTSPIILVFQRQPFQICSVSSKAVYRTGHVAVGQIVAVTIVGELGHLWSV